MSDFCISTLTTKSYLIGTTALLKSIVSNNKWFNGDFVIISNDIDEADIDCLKKIYPNIKRVFIDDSIYGYINEYTDSQLSWKPEIQSKFIHMYHKFEVFGLSEYDKVVFLDSDTIVLGDIGALFGINCDFAAVKDQSRGDFNSGVMLIGSKYLNNDVKRDMIRLADKMIKGGNIIYDIGSTMTDQSVINEYFGNNYYELPQQFNLFKTDYVSSSWVANTKIVHYIYRKPWENASDNVRDNIETLWDRYNVYREVFGSKIDIQISLREEFGTLLNRLGLNGNGIEIGVCEGEFSEILLKTSNLKKLYLLDLWQHIEDGYIDRNNVDQNTHEARYFQVLSNMEKYGNRVTVIRADCDVAHRYSLDNHFDFIYLDADHSYESVKRQLHNWYPKVRKGGILAGHDYISGVDRAGTVFGVKDAVDEYCKENNIKLYVTTDDTPYFADGTKVPDHLRYYSWYFLKDELLEY
jgi:lipopolysaccharide biosynthesis glycosyltransferase